MNPSDPPGQFPLSPVFGPADIAKPSDAVIVGHMVQTVVTAFGEAEKSRLEQTRLETSTRSETSRLGFRLGLTTLWCGVGIIALFSGMALYAFSGGEKALLGQVVSGGFGFLAGIGMSRFMPQTGG
jgi:hypothetical protein